MGSPRLSQADGSPPWLKHFQGPSVGYSSSTRLEALVPSHYSRATTRLPGIRARGELSREAWEPMRLAGPEAKFLEAGEH